MMDFVFKMTDLGARDAAEEEAEVADTVICDS